MKFGSREVCDMVFKAKARTKIGSHTFEADEPVLYIDTAKTSTFEGAASTVYAEGGKGNARLIAWEGDKTVTFTVEDALISPIGLAVLTGADLIKPTEAAPIYAHVVEKIEVTEDGKITLTRKPSTNNNAKTFAMLCDNAGTMSGIPAKVDLTDATVYNSETEPLVINSPLAKKDDIWQIDYYYETYGDAQQIDIAPDKFAGFYYVEASTLFRREDGIDLPAEFIIPKVKIQSNFSFSMSSSGDPSSFTFTMDAFSDYMKFDKTKKVLATIQILDADDNYDLTGSDSDTGDSLHYERYTYDKDGGDFLTAYEEKEDSVTDDIFVIDKDGNTESIGPADSGDTDEGGTESEPEADPLSDNSGINLNGLIGS